MIGKLNRRVTIKRWTSSTDDAGGLTSVQTASYSIWAKVEPRNGAVFTGQEQTLWNYDYKVTFRYERSRVVQSNFTIDYDGKRLRINSISFENEGERKYSVARCTTTDEQIDGSVVIPLDEDDWVNIGSSVMQTVATFADLTTATAAFVIVTTDSENNDDKSLYIRDGSSYTRMHTF